MLNAYATPQIFIQGRILNANGFNSDELYIKYKIIINLIKIKTNIIQIKTKKKNLKKRREKILKKTKTSKKN